MYFSQLLNQNSLLNHSTGCCFCVDSWTYVAISHLNYWYWTVWLQTFKFTTLSSKNRNRIQNLGFFYTTANKNIRITTTLMHLHQGLACTAMGDQLWVAKLCTNVHCTYVLMYQGIQDNLASHPQLNRKWVSAEMQLCSAAGQQRHTVQVTDTATHSNATLKR